AGLPIVEDCDKSDDAEKNDDGECSPFTHADENVEMVREYDEEFEPATNMCPDCEGSGQVHAGGDEQGLWDCDRCNGEGEIFEGEVEEDFLAPPQDVEDTYDTGEGDYPDDYDETNLQAFDRDMSDSEPFSDDYPIDEATYTRQDFRMVADTLQNIGDPFIRQQQAEEYAAKFAASNPRFNKELFMNAAGVTYIEEGPGDDEFAHDDDAMVDVGDEDYDSGEDLSDFGGEYYGDSQYYETIEMNELRKAAGLAQVNEESKTKGFFGNIKPQEVWWENDPEDLMDYYYWRKSQISPTAGSSAFARNWNKIVTNLSKKNPPPEGWVNPVPRPEPEEMTCPACQGRGSNYEKDEVCYKCDGEGTIIESTEMNESNGAGYDFIDFVDEQAYYAVADEIGDRVIFGMHNEVGIPEEYSKKIENMLRRQGFEKGIDYNYTSRGNPGHPSNREAEVEEDLQNGYNDKKYADGEDFFPKGSHQSPSDDLGPTASGYGDNAMKNRMRSKETDAVYESMKQSYRRFRKS
ncbi:MAG: hypothetical protein ACTSPB_23560, partial [Candidatus Thorarchaeota archaeon]